MKTVFVGMSGGVDSSVTAALLQEQGYRVIGVFMKNWSGHLQTERGDFEFPCAAQADFEDARRAAGHLGIPLYTFDFEDQYREKVIEYFVQEISKGRTPNPDVMCNKEIKFKAFLDKCLQLGADYIATGHYVRREEDQGRYWLAKGRDENKDQSYFLATLGQEELQYSLFPLGDMKKPSVREKARELHLPNADKPDSQGICFVGEIDINEFIKAFIGEAPGAIVDEQGQVLGEHPGVYFYTIGQRKGLGIGGGTPYFVVDKRLETRELVVAKGMMPDALYTSEVFLDTISWVNRAPDFPYTCQAKIRYRSSDITCTVYTQEDYLRVVFKEPQRAVTEGQFLVLYQDDYLIGSGIMNRLWT